MNARILPRIAASTLAAIALAGCTPSEAQSPDPSNTQTETSNSPAGDNDHQRLDEQLTNLEDRYDARVGVSALDTETGEAVDHRADERFGFASTLKVFAVAELLDRTKPDDLEKNVTWTQADVDEAGWTPVTEKHVDDGLPLDDVAESALRVSDNLAMNIVLDELGGPEALDDALEKAGDTTTEVTDEEPALNDVEDGSTDNTPPRPLSPQDSGTSSTRSGSRTRIAKCSSTGCRRTRPVTRSSAQVHPTAGWSETNRGIRMRFRTTSQWSRLPIANPSSSPS